MDGALHVFVSSTSLDLQPERAAVEAVLDGFAEAKFVGMEHFGSRDEGSRQASIDEVDQCRLYIGVLGGRWGSGITHDEYRRARERGLHCLIYLKSEAAIDAAGAAARDADLEARERRLGFIEELKSQHIVRAAFERADQLATQVAIDLHRWLFDAARQESAAALRDKVVDFRPLIAAETAGFEGRDALFGALSRHAAEDEAGGYFALEADAGLGKTAFAAEVARRWDTPAWFCSVAENRTSARAALEHLCAELILRWDLPHHHLPPHAGEDSSFLAALLAQAAAKAVAAGLRLWLVVDALDEADPLGPGRSPLLLPPELPPGCCVLLTMRPATPPVPVRPGTRWRVHRLQPDDPMQRDDLRAWLRSAFRRPRVTAACAAARPPVSEDDFVERLAAAAAGNFKYLTYVVADIGEAAAPGYAPLQLEHLPAGLQSYYVQFWSRMGLDDLPARDWQLWDGLVRPVLALLGTAGEPVTAAWFADLTGRTAREVEERVLRPWRRFLAHDGAGRWRIVHKSFADFLGGRPELDLPATHQAVAQWLADAARWPAHDAYALRQRAGHLRHAGDGAALDALIDDEAWFAAHEAADASAAGFLADVMQVWAWHAEADRAAATAGQPLPALAAEVRCALLAATLRQRSANMPPGLLAALVRQGHWQPVTALAVIDQMPEAGDRDDALLALAPVLPDDASVLQALQRHPAGAAHAALAARLAALGHGDAALALALAAPDPLRALSVVTPQLAPLLLRERAARDALTHAAAAQTAVDERDRREGWRTLGPFRHLEQLQAVLDVLPADALDRLAADIAAAPLRERWQPMLERAHALHAARQGDDAPALVRIKRDGDKLAACQLAADTFEILQGAVPPVAPGFAARALELLLERDTGWLSADFTQTAGRLAVAAGDDAVDRLATWLLSSPGAIDAHHFAGAAAWWPSQRLDEALRRIEDIADRDERRRARVTLAPAVLRKRGAPAALELVGRDADSYDRADAITDLLHALPLERRDKAHEVLGQLRRDDFLPGALQAVARHLPTDAIDAAFALAERIKEPQHWARAAGALAQRLAELGEPARAMAVLHRLNDDDGARRRLRGSVAWLIARAGNGAAALAQSSALLDDANIHLSTLAALTDVMPADRTVALFERLARACGAAERAGGATHEGEQGLLRAVPALHLALGFAGARQRISTSLRGTLRCRVLLELAARGVGPDADELQAEALATLEAEQADDSYWVAWALQKAAPTLGAPAVRRALAWVPAARRPERISSHLDEAEAALWQRRIALGDRRGAEAVARRLSDDRSRIRVLVALVPGATAARRGALVAHLMQVVAGSHYLQGEYLQPIVPVLDAATLPQLEALLPAIRQDADRMTGARLLAARVSQLHGPATALALVQGWADAAMVQGGIAGIAPHAGPNELTSLQALCTNWTREHHLRHPGVAIAARRAELGETDAALAIAAELRDEAAYEAIAPWLDAARVQRARAGLRLTMMGTFRSAAGALAFRLAQLGDYSAALEWAFTLDDRDGDRLRTLSRIVDLLGAARDDAAAAAWQQGVRTAAGLSRPLAIEVVRRLLPLAARLAPPGGLVAQADAVDGVMGRWR